MRVKFLKAFNGDSILVNFIDEKNISRNFLIDGGTPRTYKRFLKGELENIVNSKEAIDLLIVTHIDDDHIGGIKELYQDTKFDKNFIKEVWFNSGNLLSEYFNDKKEKEREVALIKDDQINMSVDQGVTLENDLIKQGNWTQNLIKFDKTPTIIYGVKMTILSPTDKELKKLHKKWETETDKKVDMSNEHDDFSVPISELVMRNFYEDKAVPNGSSIAILLEHEKHTILLLGDAHPSVIVKSLKSLGYSTDNKLKADIVKVSHHASKGNTNKELLSLIRCGKYMISTDGSKHGLPDKEAIANIINMNPNCKLFFNYDDFSNNLFLDDDRKNYKFEVCSLSQLDFTIEL